MNYIFFNFFYQSNKKNGFSKVVRQQKTVIYNIDKTKKRAGSFFEPAASELLRAHSNQELH